MAELSLPVPFFFKGTPHFKSVFGVVTTPGIEQTLLTDDAVLSGTKRQLYRVVVTSSYSGLIKIKVGADVIGSDRIRSGKPTIQFDWVPPRGLTAGQQVVITFEQTGGPVVSVDAYIMSEDINT